MSDLLVKRKTIVLDRDGVVIEYVPEIHKLVDVKLRQNTAEAIRLFNQNNFRVVVATNQPMVAKGLLTLTQLNEMHQLIANQLKAFGAHIDQFYFCPHHPDKESPGGIPELKGPCDCRKPKTGMLKQADLDQPIDISLSWMVGDTWRDAECGKAFGLKTIGLCGGAGFPYQKEFPLQNGFPFEKGQEIQPKVQPDFICADLLEAAKIIIK